MRAGDSETAEFKPKAGPGSEDYREKVAIPTMQAINAMPVAYRLLVKEYDYVDVYRAYMRRMSPEAIKRRAESNGGRFVL